MKLFRNIAGFSGLIALALLANRVFPSPASTEPHVVKTETIELGEADIEDEHAIDQLVCSGGQFSDHPDKVCVDAQMELFNRLMARNLSTERMNQKFHEFAEWWKSVKRAERDGSLANDRIRQNILKAQWYDLMNGD